MIASCYFVFQLQGMAAVRASVRDSESLSRDVSATPHTTSISMSSWLSPFPLFSLGLTGHRVVHARGRGPPHTSPAGRQGFSLVP